MKKAIQPGFAFVRSRQVVTITSALALWLVLIPATSADDGSKLTIKEIEFDAEKSKLKVKGKGKKGETVTVSNAATAAVVGSDEVDGDEWKVQAGNLSSVPCRVRAAQSNGEVAEMDVEDAPPDCDDGASPITGDFTVVAANDLGMHPGVQVLDELGVGAFDGLCADATNETDCPSALALFEPIALDLGIPVPDPAELYPESPSDVPLLVTGQQQMPGVDNAPHAFDRFDVDLPFFVNFPFGARLRDLNWFAADGIPIMPVDDVGRSNPYPLMKVAAHDRATGRELASLNVVLPGVVA